MNPKGFLITLAFIGLLSGAASSAPGSTYTTRCNPTGCTIRTVERRDISVATDSYTVTTLGTGGSSSSALSWGANYVLPSTKTFTIAIGNVTQYVTKERSEVCIQFATDSVTATCSCPNFKGAVCNPNAPTNGAFSDAYVRSAATLSGCAGGNSLTCIQVPMQETSRATIWPITNSASSTSLSVTVVEGVATIVDGALVSSVEQAVLSPVSKASPGGMVKTVGTAVLRTVPPSSVNFGTGSFYRGVAVAQQGQETFLTPGPVSGQDGCRWHIDQSGAATVSDMTGDFLISGEEPCSSQSIPVQEVHSPSGSLVRLDSDIVKDAGSEIQVRPTSTTLSIEVDHTTPIDDLAPATVRGVTSADVMGSRITTVRARSPRPGFFPVTCVTASGPETALIYADTGDFDFSVPADCSQICTGVDGRACVEVTRVGPDKDESDTDKHGIRSTFGIMFWVLISLLVVILLCAAIRKHRVSSKSSMAQRAMDVVSSPWYVIKEARCCKRYARVPVDSSKGTARF